MTEVKHRGKKEMSWKIVWRFPGIYLKKNKKSNSKRYMHPSDHSRTVYNSQDMEAIQMPINKLLA